MSAVMEHYNEIKDAKLLAEFLRMGEHVNQLWGKARFNKRDFPLIATQSEAKNPALGNRWGHLEPKARTVAVVSRFRRLRDRHGI